MKIPPNIKSYLGQKNERLSVIGFAGFDKKRNSLWECACECGTKKIIAGYHFKKTKSCGCFKAECTRKRFTKHGFNKNAAERTNLYSRWIDMRRRCKPAYENHHRYFDRGITVCKEWNSFSEFMNYVSDNLGPCPTPSALHSIDRIRNNEGYKPGNIRWATHVIQARNTGRNRIVEHQGRSAPLAVWCEERGLSWQRTRDRLKLGWSVEDAFSLPKQIKKRKAHQLPPPQEYPPRESCSSL